MKKLIIIIFLTIASFAHASIYINKVDGGELIEVCNDAELGWEDIGCWILTNGKWVMTIPPKTIVHSGSCLLSVGSNKLNSVEGRVALFDFIGVFIDGITWGDKNWSKKTMWAPKIDGCYPMTVTIPSSTAIELNRLGFHRYQ